MLPHRQHDRGDATGQRELGQVRLDPRLQHPLVVHMKRMPVELGDHRRGGTLENRLQHRLALPVQTSGLTNHRSRPLPVLALHPVRRRPRHDGQPAVAPELSSGPKPVWGDHDGHHLCRPKRSHPRRGRQRLHDGMCLRFLEQPSLGLLAKRNQLVELPTKPLRGRTVPRRRQLLQPLPSALLLVNPSVGQNPPTA